MRRTDVEVERSSDGGKREETIGEQKTSITARPTRNRPKRPEVQRYVPRGRRLQEEAERKAGRTREDDSTQQNAESLSKSHNTTKIDTEYKRTKDEIALISSGKKMPRTREENCAQIHPQETEAKTMGDNSYQQNKNDRKDRIKGENSPRLKTERRIRKLREDNSSLKCEENVTKTSDGRLADDSGDSRSLSHVNVKPNHGSDRKKQTKGNVYVPPGRRKATSERVDNSETEGFTLERVENSDKEIVTSKGIDNLDQEVVEMSTDNHPVLLVDKDEREKMIKEIDHADCEIKSSSYDEEECSGRQQDDMECSQKQEYGSNNKSQEIFEYDKIEMSKDEVQLADSETEEFVMCETSFDGDAAVKNVSEGYTDLRETRHVEADNQKKKMGEIEEPLSREGKDVSKEDVEEDLVSVNKKMKVECSTTPQSLEHSKTKNDSVDDVNILSHDDTSAICNDHDTSMISDEKESSYLDILMTKNEDSQIHVHVDGNKGDNEGSVSSDLTDKICEGKLTGNESIDREAMETNETMDADDTKEMIGSDDQLLANEKQLDSSEVHEEKKEGDDKMNEQQTNVDERINDDNDEEEEDEDSWDKMFDDEGECLDPSAVEEVLTKKVGKVKIQKAKINYLDFKPKDPDLNYDEMGHVIEIFGFPAEFKTEDLLSIFQPYKDKGFDIKWVDDTHALGVFSSPIAAQSALSLVHPLCKVGPLTDAARASKVKAKRAVEFLQPYKPRPETSASAARRLVSGALGLSTRVSKEQREKERQKLREAKEKRKMERKQKDDIWEGTCTSSHSHDDR
ncbi:hypothetical protein FSP39_016823 [Pinctada imbricata]|uniref:Coiled-coil domain-containing protein R3HCC1L n=1 Tax=Pinctada imbricata TaxID=66713 RepID=A0AA89BTU3_PINIB|nr:hypothetical protein FSP39_016823 [Pinctada imbricata]